MPLATQAAKIAGWLFASPPVWSRVQDIENLPCQKQPTLALLRFTGYKPSRSNLSIEENSFGGDKKFGQIR